MALAQTKIYTEDDYYSLPENVRAELIDGDFYDMAAPSRLHQEIVMFLSKVIANYIDAKQGSCKVYPAPFAVKLFADQPTIVEPDISVICDPHKLTDRGCTGAPDWVVEVSSPGTASRDYIRKLNMYADAGVREYWIVDPSRKKIMVYYFAETGLETEDYTFQDKVKVHIYDDLYIDFSGLSL